MEDQLVDKNRKRGIRRDIKRKIGKKVFKYYHDLKDAWVRKWIKEDPEWKAGQEGFYSKTRVPCSGFCCGNPRKHFNEKTIQELKSEEDFENQLNEDLEEDIK